MPITSRLADAPAVRPGRFLMASNAVAAPNDSKWECFQKSCTEVGLVRVLFGRPDGFWRPCVNKSPVAHWLILRENQKPLAPSRLQCRGSENTRTNARSAQSEGCRRCSLDVHVPIRRMHTIQKPTAGLLINMHQLGEIKLIYASKCKNKLPVCQSCKESKDAPSLKESWRKLVCQATDGAQALTRGRPRAFRWERA